MQTLMCNIENWNVEARIDAVDDCQSIAIVRAMLKNEDANAPSRHVMVFDHQPGGDRMHETRTAIEQMLQSAH